MSCAHHFFETKMHTGAWFQYMLHSLVIAYQVLFCHPDCFQPHCLKDIYILNTAE